MLIIPLDIVGAMYKFDVDNSHVGGMSYRLTEHPCFVSMDPKHFEENLSNFADHLIFIDLSNIWCREDVNFGEVA